MTRSAGLLVHRRAPDGALEILIVHPGGPFWARRDERAWSIPKGEHLDDEEPERAALREFEEELGVPPPDGPRLDLGEVVQRGGKRVRAWAVRGDLDVTDVHGATVELAWPPRSGRRQRFPDVDRAAWVSADAARAKLVEAQVAFVDRLVALMAGT